MKTLFLPKKLRSKLRKPLGLVISGRKKEVAEKFKEFCQKKKIRKVITVGDYCSLNLPSQIKIFDGKIRKRRVKLSLKFSLTCSNPPGTIQKEVWPILKKALKENKNVFVVGEEDLLVLPAVLLAPKNSLVVYGLFGQRVVLIEVSSTVKRKIKKILEKFSSSLC